MKWVLAAKCYQNISILQSWLFNCLFFFFLFYFFWLKLATPQGQWLFSFQIPPPAPPPAMWGVTCTCRSVTKHSAPVPDALLLLLSLLFVTFWCSRHSWRFYEQALTWTLCIESEQRRPGACPRSRGTLELNAPVALIFPTWACTGSVMRVHLGRKWSALVPPVLGSHRLQGVGEEAGLSWPSGAGPVPCRWLWEMMVSRRLRVPCAERACGCKHLWGQRGKREGAREVWGAGM